MAGLSFKIITDREGWLKAIRDQQRPVATAAVAALKDVADAAVREGRSNIAGSGRFGARWINALRFSMQGGEEDLQAKAIVFHAYNIAGVFEQGATIQGKPLLWIPTMPGGPPARRSGKKLVSATIHGRPVLFDANDRDRHRKPLYVGVPAVRIPKKWHIVDIVKKHAAQIAEAFIRHFKAD
jgi:uncharacterized protein DUF6441